MNCDEFRQQLLIDPCCGDRPFVAHAHACSECARAAEEALRLERLLHRALTAELSETGELRSRWQVPPRSERRYALLAMPLLLAALWLGLRTNIGPESDTDLAADIIAHIGSEIQHLRSTGTVPWASVVSLFQSLGADVDPTLGPVRFAGRCVIANGEGIHLVLPGERGAVTALFMPASSVSEEREVAGGGLAGTILPAGSGSLAIVGEFGEQLWPVARRLRAAVRWHKPEQ